MARCILLFVLLSPVLPYCVPSFGFDIDDGASRAPLTVAAAFGGDDGLVCGECPCTEQEDGAGRPRGGGSPAIRAPETAPARGGSGVSATRRLGPILSCLSDSLILSRPPPSVAAGS